MKFNLEFAFTIFIALLSSYIIWRYNPSTSPIIVFFIIPILVSYIIILIINNVFPKINELGKDIKHYTEDKVMSTIDTTNYMFIFPPLFFVFILFIILLYSGHLN